MRTGTYSHGHLARASLDQGLQSIGVLTQDEGAQRRLAGQGAKAARRIWDSDTGSLLDDPAAHTLQPALERRKVTQSCYSAIPHDHFGLTRENRGNKGFNVCSAILIIGVGIDDDVGTQS